MSDRTVVLTEAEVRICEWVGRQRYANAVANHRNAGEGPSKNLAAPDNHIRGAKCEFAASVILNLSWRPTVGKITEPDVGGIFEVRSTDLPHGRLIVKPADRDAPFILIIQLDALRYRSPGWFEARDAKRLPLLTRHGDPAHFVEQAALRPLQAINSYIDKARGALV